MDSYDRKDLLLCIEGLGRQVKLESDDGEETILVYQKGPDSLGCLQDIQRFLRRDDLESKSFHIQLGTWNVLSAHLLPMLASYRDSHEYAFEIVKLMVMLTMPAEAKMRDPTEYNRRLAVYLESFVNHDILAILMSISAGPLSRGGAQRTHNDIQVLELILTLIRNLLSIVPIKSNVREELLFAMDKESILLLLLHIASQIEASENARFSLIILETFHLLFANQDPLVIASIMESHPIPVQSIQEKPVKGQKERNLEESGLTIPSLHSSSASTSRPSPSSSSKQPMSARGAALGALLASSSPTKTSSAARHSRFGGYVLATPKIQPSITSAEILGQQTSYSASSAPVSGEPSRPGSQSANGSSSASSSSTSTTTAANNTSSSQPGKKKPMPGVEFNQKDGSVASSMISIMDVLNPKLQHAKGIHLGGGGRGMRTKSGGEDAQASKRSQHALASSSLLSGFSSKLILKNFAHRVLDHCFNELMRVIKALVESHSPNLMSNDLDNYVWAIGFFPAFLAGSFLFQRNGNADNFSFSPESLSSAENSQSKVEDPYNQSRSSIHLDIGTIHAIFEEETFNYLLEQLERYETEKVVSKVELHFLALKQLIYVLLAMHGSGSSEHVGIAEKIVLQLIYDPELLIDRLPRLVGTFAILKRGASLLLPPLIEGVHLLLTLLEKISDGGQKKLVQLKKRSKSTMDRGLLGSKEVDEEEAISKLDGDDDILDENEKDSPQGKEGNTANSMLLDEVVAQNSKRKTSTEDGVSDAYNGGQGDQDSDDEFAAKAKRLKEELAMMEEADEDEDAANREKYFDVQDYYIWFFKKHVVDAIVTLLQSYETNLDRTNEAVIGILKRVETVEGLAMLFQVNHLRIIASILIEKTSVEEKIVNSHAVGSGASKESKEKVKAFCRKVAGDFLDSFYKDPVTIGLTTLWPKKLSRARDLVSGTYLTTDSYYDGTLEIQEEAWMREAQKALDWEMEHNMEPMEEDDDYDDQLIPRRHNAEHIQEEKRMHQKNPSSVRSSRNERARPYLAEGMQGNDGFDLSTVLRKPKEKEEEKKTKQEESLALLRARRNQAQELSGDSSSSTTLQPIVRRKKTAEERQEEAWAKIRSGTDSSARSWTAEETEEVKTLYAKYKDMARSGDLDVIALVKSMVSTKSFDETVCTLSDLYLQLEKILPAEEFHSIKRPELELEEEEEEEEDVQEKTNSTLSSSYIASTRPSNRSSSMDIDHNINREAPGHIESTSLQIGRARTSTSTRRSLYEEEDDDGGGAIFSRANGSKSHGGSYSDVELDDDDDDEEDEAQVRPREMSRVKKGTNPTLIIRPHNVGGSTVLSSVNVTGGKTARQVLEEMAQRKREREEEEAKQREENALRRAEEKEARMKQRALRDEEDKLEREARRQAKIRAREEAKEAKVEQKAAAKEAKKQERAQEREAKRLEKAENKKKTATGGTLSSTPSKGRPLPSMEGIDEEDLMFAPKPSMDQSNDQGEEREIEGEEKGLSAQLSPKQKAKPARAKPRPKARSSITDAGSDNAELSSSSPTPPTPPARRPQRQASKRAAEASFFQRILAEQQEEEEEDNNDNSDKDSRPIKTRSGSKRTTSSSQPSNLLLDDEGEELEGGGDGENLPDSVSKVTKKRKRPARMMSNKNDDDNDDDFTLDDDEEDNDEFNTDIYHDNEDARGTRSRKRGGKKSSAKKTGALLQSSSSSPAKKKRKLTSKSNDYYEDDIHPDDMDVLMARSDDDDNDDYGKESKSGTGSAKLRRAIASDWATTEEVPGEASTTISQKKRKLVRNTSRLYDDDDNYDNDYDNDVRSGEVGGKGVSSLNSSFQGTSNTRHVNDDEDEIMLDD